MGFWGKMYGRPVGLKLFGLGLTHYNTNWKKEKQAKKLTYSFITYQPGHIFILSVSYSLLRITCAFFCANKANSVAKKQCA
jgi:hypothetical protein